ncbi:hypothetical protein D6833_08945 [Candidatus Parcubacteria bacterium]|nr:MAG: hypothetical protein D6833_08945 [Candidatus Parcubacteria bacterium]
MEMPPAVAAMRWERVYDGTIFPRADVQALAVDPQDPSIVYAATGPTTWGGGTGSGIYKSTDGGETWQFVSADLPRQSFSALITDPYDSQIVYAAPVGEQIYKSTNGGETWELLRGSPRVRNWNAVGNFGVDMADSQHIYYFDSEHLYETVDRGESWQVLSVPCEGWTFVVDPENGKHLFISCWNQQRTQNLGESWDGGRTWNLLDFLTPADILSLVVAPGSPGVLYAHYESGLAKSIDGGRTWSYLRESGARSALAVHPANPDTVILGQPSQWGGGSIERSLNGGVTWETVGWADGGTNTIQFAPSDPRFVYLGAAGV